jgi:hypothetical protein
LSPSKEICLVVGDIDDIKTGGVATPSKKIYCEPMKRYYNLLMVLPILMLTACSDGAKRAKIMPRDYYCDNDPTRPKYLGNCGGGTATGTGTSVGSGGNSYLSLVIIILVFLVILLCLYALFLVWVWKAAIRNQRSGVGFVWLGILTPYIAWVILLILDKRETESRQLIA